MSYLAEDIRGRLQQAFATEHMTLDIQPDYVVVQDSAQCTREKILRIIQQVAFMCPFISEYTLDGNFVFTVVPYKKADAFIHKEELESLLAPNKYSGPKVGCPQTSGSLVNEHRAFVYPALSSCVSGIVERLSEKDDRPIVEIGSGIGYELSKTVASKTIRTQPNQHECLLLDQTISNPIYVMSIQDLYRCLHEKGKKIPLFFALNVFDTMSLQERQECFSQIAQLQSRGNRLVIMLDENPEFAATIQQLEALHPGTIALPLLPLSLVSAKLSFVLVPAECVSCKPTPNDIVDMIHEDATSLANGRPSKRQIWIHQLQMKQNLKVIALEDFYVDQVKNELANAGYTSRVYYDASFVLGKLPKGATTPGDLVYRPVTDTITIKSWEVEDQNLKEWLKAKGLQVPPHLNKELLSQIRARGQKILGAEVLVIEATKK